MPGPDPTHWLHRLAPDEWLAAAENELAAARQALERRSVRAGVTHARRAAGMALNGRLCLEERPSWGRSYMEHIVALSTDEAAPAAIRQAALHLKATPAQPPPLVTLVRPAQLPPGGAEVMEATLAILEWVRARLPRAASPVN